MAFGFKNATTGRVVSSSYRPPENDKREERKRATNAGYSFSNNTNYDNERNDYSTSVPTYAQKNSGLFGFFKKSAPIPVYNPPAYQDVHSFPTVTYPDLAAYQPIYIPLNTNNASYPVNNGNNICKRICNLFGAIMGAVFGFAVTAISCPIPPFVIAGTLLGAVFGAKIAESMCD